jgi:sulfate transport system permease protein
MDAQGVDEEEAALILGATGLQMFLRVTLPKIRWGLLQGVLLCSARSMGEFGAVSVISGRIRGLTNTVPLHIEILYNEYDIAAAFAVATLLAAAGILTIGLRAALEWRQEGAYRRGSLARLEGAA